MWPEYIYSIVHLLRPEHVIEQWQEREAAERGAAARTAAGAAAARQSQSWPADQPASAAVDAPAALQAGSTGAVEPTNGGSGTLMRAISGTMKQPPGQVAQFKFALTSAFLEQVLAWKPRLMFWCLCDLWLLEDFTCPPNMLTHCTACKLLQER